MNINLPSPVWKKLIISFFIIFFILTFRIFPEKLPYLDEKGDEYFKTAIKETIVVYGIARITNAIVSVAKETEIDISPAGVGLTLHIGQILDPLDDATERLSTVLTISLGLIGLMKISKEILTVYSFNIISYILIILLPSIWIDRLRSLVMVITGIVILILALRLALPVCGIVNNLLYEDFFKPRIEQNLVVFKDLSKLENKFSKEDTLIINTNQKDEGFFAKLKSFEFGWNILKEKSQLAKEVSIYVWKNKDRFIDAVVNLIVLEISLIVIQTIVIPISIFLILLKLANNLFERREKFEDIIWIIEKRLKQN